MRSSVSTDARRRIDAWRPDYNSVRQHSAVGKLAPDPFLQLHLLKTSEPLTDEWCTRRGKVRSASRKLTDRLALRLS
ncbi:integrase core domain-containing protein [Burkholderia sp. S-53]|uniref:integrase core domain-containing protein n=1 Tax=Burkholderia sp. S-53 TaxID=2906514 RepID=UPI00399AA691